MTILRRYAGLVCFALVIINAFTISFFLYKLVILVSPEIEMNSHQYEKYMDNTKYASGSRILIKGSDEANSPSDHQKSWKVMDEEEITRTRLEEYSKQLDSVRRESKKSALKLVLFMLTSVILYGYHYRLAKNKPQN